MVRDAEKAYPGRDVLRIHATLKLSNLRLVVPNRQVGDYTHLGSRYVDTAHVWRVSVSAIGPSDEDRIERLGQGGESKMSVKGLGPGRIAEWLSGPGSGGQAVYASSYRCNHQCISIR